MTAVKGLALGIVVVTGVALEARGEPVRRGSWRWTSWVAGRGVFQAGLSGASSLVPPAAPAAASLPAPAPVLAPPPAPVYPVLPPPAPYPSASLGRFAVTSPVATAPAVETAPIPVATADAFLHFGAGPYPQADFLTAGGARPWYTSPVVSRLFGGTPDAQQQAAFTAAVLQRVEQTYRQSGLALTLTDDPQERAAHTVSLVAETFHPDQPEAIGIASRGADGFSFVDKFGQARTIDELQWAIARNVSHELMHAFGVDHHDITGRYLDAHETSWAVLIDPAAGFSAGAVQELATKDFRRPGSWLGGLSAELVTSRLPDSAAPVPEPATLGLWAVALSGVAVRATLPPPARSGNLAAGVMQWGPTPRLLRPPRRCCPR